MPISTVVDIGRTFCKPLKQINMTDNSMRLRAILLILVSVGMAINSFALDNIKVASAILKQNRQNLHKVWDSNDLAEFAGKATHADFEVIANKNGNGFAIVSGESVIGYSLDTEAPSIEEIPENMLHYLKNFSSRASEPQKANIGNVVVQLETPKWAQRDPYNRLCPEKNGKKCITGCIPTAFAIVMRYHKWPQHGTGKVYNPITGEAVDISQHTYNWDNMLMEYKSGEFTEEQANEVAALMMHLGFAYMVSYGTNSTDGNHNSDKISKYFEYENVGKTQRWQVSNAEWERLIKESLDNGCPIPYAATNTGTGDAKHIFVLDGYTDSGYYHFNWGWGGNGNGYFKLSDMTPLTGDNYSKADTHQAYFNLRPIKPDTPEYTIGISVSDSNAGTATVNGKSSITVEEGTEILLQATANEGYEFLNWTVDGTQISDETEYSTTATQSCVYTANFQVSTDIKELAGNTFVESSGNCINVNTSGSGAVIYNSSGAVIKEIGSNRRQSTQLPKGIYIVSDKEKSVKISIK